MLIDIEWRFTDRVPSHPILSHNVKGTIQKVRGSKTPLPSYQHPGHPNLQASGRRKKYSEAPKSPHRRIADQPMVLFFLIGWGWRLLFVQILDTSDGGEASPSCPQPSNRIQPPDVNRSSVHHVNSSFLKHSRLPLYVWRTNRQRLFNVR